MDKPALAEETADGRGRGKGWRGRRGGGGGGGGGRGGEVLVGSQSPLDEDSSPPVSPACHQEIAGGFPELFRQAILEVDQLTQQLGEEARRGEEGDSSEGGEEKVVQHKSRPGSKRRRKKALEAAEQARQGGEVESKGETTPRLTPTPRYLSFCSSR